MANSTTSETSEPDSFPSEKLIGPLLKGQIPPIDGDLEQDISLSLDKNGQPYANIQPASV